MPKKKIICISIVNPYPLLKEGLRFLMKEHPGIRLVSEGKDQGDAIKIAKNDKIDVLVLLSMGSSMDDLKLVQKLCEEKMDSRLLIRTRDESLESIVRLLRVGAAGWLTETVSFAELIKAIQEIAAGELYLPENIKYLMAKHYIHSIQPPSGLEALTERESQVLGLLAKGRTNREAAEELGLSISTFYTSRSLILRKLHLRNNSDLTRFAIKNGVISL